eukprot:TRINITY_DN8309_c0_g5_i1.p1 TRINITY_DN8309_c0_g5~~TRINITY_DN8309_c0_g5_i1.p1  ORF type:complete len:104 (-),score=0.02 TRINITY_DN8309_c0_g5_i1:149-460(-)
MHESEAQLIHGGAYNTREWSSLQEKLRAKPSCRSHSSTVRVVNFAKAILIWPPLATPRALLPCRQNFWSSTFLNRGHAPCTAVKVEAPANIDSCKRCPNTFPH